MNEPLSPAAQAVIIKVQATLPDYMISDRAAGFFAAAALRAAANYSEYLYDSQDGKTAVVRVADLEAWAAELETPNV